MSQGRPPGRRIVLHIGTEKTGTTSLQSTLSANREALWRAGVAYLSTPGRIDARGLAAAALQDKMPDEYLRQRQRSEPAERAAFREETARQLQGELVALPEGIHTVILSSEHFHSRLRRPDEIAWLAEQLTGWADTFQVVPYLRRQVEVMTSFYSTELKNGGRRTLSNAAEKMCRPGNHYFAYERMLGLWAEAFGEAAVTPRIFEPGALVGDDLVTDFLSLLGLADLELPEAPERWLNESLTPLGQALVRGLNAERAECAEDDPLREELRRLRKEAIKTFPGTGATLPLKEARSLQAAFEEGNRAVAARWFPDRSELFAPVTRENYPTVRLGPWPSREQLAVVRRALDLADQQGGEGRRLVAFDACAVLLRDLAVAQEGEDPAAAEACMALAGRIRPNGPFIHKRLAAYRERNRERPWYGRLLPGRQAPRKKTGQEGRPAQVLSVEPARIHGWAPADCVEMVVNGHPSTPLECNPNNGFFDHECTLDPGDVVRVYMEDGRPLANTPWVVEAGEGIALPASLARENPEYARAGELHALRPFDRFHPLFGHGGSLVGAVAQRSDGSIAAYRFDLGQRAAQDLQTLHDRVLQPRGIASPALEEVFRFGAGWAVAQTYIPGGPLDHDRDWVDHVPAILEQLVRLRDAGREKRLPGMPLLRPQPMAWRLLRRCGRVAVTPKAARGLPWVLSRVMMLPRVLAHGDLHRRNVLIHADDGQPTLIDWDRWAYLPVGFDEALLLRGLGAERIEELVGGDPRYRFGVLAFTFLFRHIDVRNFGSSEEAHAIHQRLLQLDRQRRG